MAGHLICGGDEGTLIGQQVAEERRVAQVGSGIYEGPPPKKMEPGSDPQLLRLTNGLLDRHIWGATLCIKDRPRPKVRPTCD
jgi:hypothetical protein